MAKNNSTKSGSFPNWQGRSGLDPVDTSRIGASVEGVFLRRLFTFALRTRNLFSLLTMFVFGIVATGLMSFAIYAIITTRPVVKLDFVDHLIFVPLYLLLGFILCVGLALLINLVINLGIMFGIIGSGSVRTRKENKKKLPKRRKDYR